MNAKLPEINRNTRISDLLKNCSEKLIPELIILNKNFSRLNNPLIRRVLAPRVTIENACKIAGCSVAEFMKVVRTLGFQTNTTEENALNSAETEAFVIDKNKLITLDVRADIKDGRDPLKKILNTVRSLSAGDTLEIINSFDPLPLKTLLAQKGFSHFSKQKQSNIFHTYFKRSAADTPLFNQKNQFVTSTAFEQILKSYDKDLLSVDVRMMEMPQPMITILNTADMLQANQALYVKHKKVPVHLLPELYKRGFDCVITETDINDVKLLIYKS